MVVLELLLVVGLCVIHAPSAPAFKAVAQDSWFPGYAWTVAYCATCFAHLGWRFTPVQPGGNHQSRIEGGGVPFWGLRRGQLTDEDDAAAAAARGEATASSSASSSDAEEEDSWEDTEDSGSDTSNDNEGSSPTEDN
jgi:hypothetical protein